MEGHGLRWTRVISLDHDVSGAGGPGLALVVTPPELARGMASLIKVSQEYWDFGLLVTNVGPGSAAAIAGIERGDVLLRYNGVPLDTTERLTQLEGVVAQREKLRATLEAVRGAREMTFAVPAARLGITVSPLLHRLASSRRATPVLVQVREQDRDAERTPEGASALVHVPGELVRQVSLLAEVLQWPGNAKRRKKVRALLATAAGIS
jgi:hypothetical protein